MWDIILCCFCVHKFNKIKHTGANVTLTLETVYRYKLFLKNELFKFETDINLQKYFPAYKSIDTMLLLLLYCVRLQMTTVVVLPIAVTLSCIQWSMTC